MESERARARAESLDEIWKWTVGGGILVVALAPLALPILILTLVALLALALPLLAVSLLGGLVTLPVLLARRLGRSIRRLRSRHRHEPLRRPVTGH
jgi:hypothetical protein